MLLFIVLLVSVLLVFAASSRVFAATQKGSIQCIGDFGNPTGTGIAEVKTSFDALTNADAVTKLTAFFAAIKLAELTDCQQADVSALWVNPAFAGKPGANCNVDRVLVATWREKTSTSIHRISIPGVPVFSTGISDEAAGERLNDVGKSALATALESVNGLAVGDVVVLQGKVYQKK